MSDPTITHQMTPDVINRLATIRERATEHIIRECADCGAPVTETAETRVGPPGTAKFPAKYTTWKHTDGRGVWCDGHSGYHAKAIVRPADSDALFLLDLIDSQQQRIEATETALDNAEPDEALPYEEDDYNSGRAHAVHEVRTALNGGVL